MSRASLARTLFLAALSVAGAAQAGTVYIPVPGNATVGTASYQVQVAVANTGTQTVTLKQALLATDTDGTQRPNPPSTTQILAGRTTVLQPGSAFKGLLEISGDSTVSYTARLAGSGPGRIGVYLPAITSSNLIPAGQTAVLQGLLSGSGRSADLNLVNFSPVASQCIATLTQTDGTVIGTPATFSLKPLSHRGIGNIFSGGSASEVRAAVTCTQSFFTFALVSDAATGEITYVGPAGSGTSTLTVPGQTPPGTCPAGATCFDAKGIVHQPTPANPVHRVQFPAPAGVAKRLRMSLDVTVGPWYPNDPEGKHLIYWFVVNRNFDMAGMLYFRGPTASTALVRHGMELTHPQKLRIEKPFAAVIGHTYHCDNDYDMAGRVYTVTVTDLTTGQIAVTLTGVPNLSSFPLKATDNLLVDMGFAEGVTVDEVPSFGWTYSNVHLEVYK
jgi:hypothetical protein